MGHKVNPIGLRLGVNRTWESRWVASSPEYADLLHADLKIRAHLKKKLANAGISKIVIERPHKKCRVTIHTARPGVVIGKKGADIESIRKELAKMVDGEVFLNLVEVRKPEVDATLVAEGVAQQLEKRVAFRRAMKRALQSAMRMGAKGCKVQVSGRLGGAEIARTERYNEGSVPLHTLRADVDYGTAEARTAYGIIGVKCWVFKGEILEHDPMASERRAQDSGEARGRQERDRRAQAQAQVAASGGGGGGAAGA
jgi:small subunit ribosomal protein S3